MARWKAVIGLVRRQHIAGCLIARIVATAELLMESPLGARHFNETHLALFLKPLNAFGNHAVGNLHRTFTVRHAIGFANNTIQRLVTRSNPAFLACHQHIADFLVGRRFERCRIGLIQFAIGFLERFA